MWNLLLAISLCGAASQILAAPHILLMVLDDIGRADTGIYGSSSIPMPKLNQLAKDGVVFENFYTQTVCSPTRSALLTGQYPFRFGMQHFTTQLPGMTAGVPLDVPMLPKLLAEKGYESHAIGKWHCGYATWGHTPMKRGFSSYTGYLQAQGDYYKHNVAIDQLSMGLNFVDGFDFWKDTQPFFKAKGNYSLDIYRQALSDVLQNYVARQDTPEKRSARPLFVYLAHQTVHVPLQYRAEESRCNSITHKVRKIYCYMMVELDDAIGEMINEYKSLGMWDDLLILAMTDNGGMVNFNPDKAKENFPTFPASQGSNYPLRGSKTTMFDGGVRSMAFASGGFIPKEGRGRRVNTLAHVVDFSATILSVANIIPAKKELLGLDGFSLLGQIINRPNTMDLRDHVPINVVLGGKRYSAVRFGDFKLIADDFLFPVAGGWYDTNGDLKEPNNSPKGAYLLFNLKDDPQERTNLADKYPHLVEHGKGLLAMYVQGGRFMEPQESFRVYARALPILHGGVWKPFMKEEDWQLNFDRQKSKSNKKFYLDSNLPNEENGSDIGLYVAEINGLNAASVYNEAVENQVLATE